MKHVFLAVLLLGSLATPSLAAPQLKVVNCDWNTPGRAFESMICNNSAFVRFDARGPEYNHAFRLTAPSTHCSKVRYVLSSSYRQIHTSRILGPGESQVYKLSGLRPGAFNIKIKAEGFKGGCNTGTLSSWGVVYEYLGFR